MGWWRLFYVKQNYSTGAKRARWCEDDAMPLWWPSNIKFRDPNNGKPKMKLWEFNLALKAYQDKFPMKGLCVPQTIK